jgi:hypothetical protein
VGNVREEAFGRCGGGKSSTGWVAVYYFPLSGGLALTVGCLSAFFCFVCAILLHDPTRKIELFLPNEYSCMTFDFGLLFDGWCDRSLLNPSKFLIWMRPCAKKS